ncbi:MAG TPA: hypothetical protein PKX14_04525 [Thauera aminoaromatica]|jgi:hypothetical protein|uniref:hypothetical protein n=1 Tax=Thauera TaxID=33057 RepID=UPI0012E05F4A|nr:MULTISPECIES: hypothetical protein [Thauera]MBL8461207.1 hypothetical protein [Thauera sp.]MBP6132069.1 hypothetical protein [Thauera sp.]MBP7048579.1 hypothetical protein [Thauera sp.]MCK6397100.1 hypothetical protein [Thauera aminoaromatica]HMV91905.1 hypothetical protein [Thauera aminoaromatica]
MKDESGFDGDSLQGTQSRREEELQDARRNKRKNDGAHMGPIVSVTPEPLT